MDDIGKDVARRGLARLLWAAAQRAAVVGRLALRPGLQARRPRPRSPSADRRSASCPCPAAGAHRRSRRSRSAMLGYLAWSVKHDRHRELAQQRDEFGRAETVVAHFDDVAQRAAVNFSGSNSRKPPKSAASNFLVGANCQSSGPRWSPSSVMPESRKRLIESPASLSTRRLTAKRGPLSANTKPGRHLACPFAKRRRRLRAVERAVDLDRGQPFACISKFLRVRQALRVKHAAPRRERPAADADVDSA